MAERIKDPTLKKNERITEVIHMFHQEPTERLLLAVILAVREIMQQDGHLVFPADIGADENGNLTFGFKTMEWDGCTAIVAFTDPEELKKGPQTDAVSQFMEPMLAQILDTEDMGGIVLNPWGEAMFLDRDDITVILNPGIERFL